MSFPPPPAFHQGPTLNPYKNDPPEKKKKTGGFVIVLLSFIVLCVSGLCYYLYSENQKLQEHVLVEITKAQTEIDTAQTEIDRLTAENKNLSELVTNRESFSQSYDDFKGALSAAVTYFDVDEWIDEGNSVYDVAVNEQQNPAVVQEQVEKIDALTLVITEKVNEHERYLSEQEKLARAGEGTVAREAMDAIDPTITLTVVEHACNSPQALACVTSVNPRDVQVTAEYVNREYDLWYSVMMHEYAHVYQFSSYSDFLTSANVETLFNKDPELHADCMAEARIGEGYVSTYGNSCSPEQLAAANGAWDGNW